MTRVAVNNANLLGPEVTLERPMCQTQCHADECTSQDDGSNKCSDSGGCYSVEGTGSGGIRSCLSEKETKAGMEQYCCDGLPKGYALSSNEVGKYAVIVDPEDYLTKACGAFDANCSMAGAHVGKKAEILSVDQDNRQ